MQPSWTDFFRIIPEVNAVMNWRDKRSDSDQLAYDFSARQKDPNYVPDLTKYNDSTIGMTANELFNKQQEQARKQQVLANFAPAYSRYEADVSQNPNTRRAEVFAFQNPEDQQSIVQGSSIIPHISQLTGAAPSEQNLYENNQKMTDRVNYAELQRQAAGLLNPSKRTGRYDDSATLLRDFAAAAQDYPVSPVDQKGLFDQLQQSMPQGYESTPSTINIPGERGAKQVVLKNRYGMQPMKIGTDYGTTPASAASSKPKWTTYYQQDGSDSVQVDANDRESVGEARASGFRPSRPAKAKGGLALPAPGGGSAPAKGAAKGGYTFINGKLVPN